VLAGVPHRLAAPLGSARGAQRWVALFALSRAVATAVAVGLLAAHRVTGHDVALMAAGGAYGALTVAVALWVPRARRSVLAWVVDALAVLALIVLSGDWRSPFYLMAVTALVPPVTGRTPRFGLCWGLAFTTAYFAVAVAQGLDLEVLRTTARLDSLATHLLVPMLVTFALAYAGIVLDRLEDERRRSERLAVEAERRRIAFELHDSAKQRVHAAHLVLSAIAPSIPPPQAPAVAQALEEMNRAAADMDTSVAELREPLDGRSLDERLRRRAEALAAATPAAIDVRGRAPELPPLVAAHAYRIAAEALTNAVRHAEAGTIRVDVDGGPGRLVVDVRDDGRGLGGDARPGSHGLRSMRHRTATLGGELVVQPGPRGRGTHVRLTVPLDREGALP
jgi:signal transduction histidine kinase